MGERGEGEEAAADLPRKKRLEERVAARKSHFGEERRESKPEGKRQDVGG